jgi:hypothetical protein
MAGPANGVLRACRARATTLRMLRPTRTEGSWIVREFAGDGGSCATADCSADAPSSWAAGGAVDRASIFPASDWPWMVVICCGDGAREMPAASDGRGDGLSFASGVAAGNLAESGTAESAVIGRGHTRLAPYPVPRDMATTRIGMKELRFRLEALRFGNTRTASGSRITLRIQSSVVGVARLSS